LKLDPKVLKSNLSLIQQGKPIYNVAAVMVIGGSMMKLAANVVKLIVTRKELLEDRHSVTNSLEGVTAKVATLAVPVALMFAAFVRNLKQSVLNINLALTMVTLLFQFS